DWSSDVCSSDLGLAGPGGGRDQHGAALLEGTAGGELEVVQREGVAGGEGGELGRGPALVLLPPPSGIALRGRGHCTSSGSVVAGGSSASRRTAPGSTRAVSGSRVRGSPSA